MLAAADEAPALNRGARQPRVRVPRKPSPVAACPVVVIPDFADTIASIKKVLTACPKPGERPSIHAPHLSKADTPKISPTDEKVW